jgi:hypothetical protein
MPHAIADGWVKRKRADELVARRRDRETADLAESMAEMFTAMAESMRTENRDV